MTSGTRSMSITEIQTIVKDEIKKNRHSVQEIVAAAIKLEREACAVICDQASKDGDVDLFESDTAEKAAGLIRKRGESNA